jgi:hypothetical protein
MMMRGWVVVVVCGGTDEDDVDEDEVGEEEAGMGRHRRRRIQRDEVGDNMMRARPCRRHMWRDKVRARRRCRRVWRNGLGDESLTMAMALTCRSYLCGEGM